MILRFVRTFRSVPVLRPMAAAALAALAACADDPPATPAARGGVDLTSIQACELLTPAEVEAATGLAASPGENTSTVSRAPPMCSWQQAESNSRVAASVLVTGGYYDTYEEVLEASEGVFTEENAQHVSDVGDFGVWLHEAKMLQVYGDRLMVQVAVETASGRDALEAAKTLAETARAKLP